MATLDGSQDAAGWRDVRSQTLAGSVVALGNFDGVHRGHLALLKALVAAGGRFRVPPAVLVLNPHPRSVLRPWETVPLLTSFGERAALLANLGVEGLFVLPFTAATAAMEPEGFIGEIVWRHLHPKAVVVGENYRFGRRARGTPETLAALGRAYGFQAIVCPSVEREGAVVSATRIRLLLKEGDVGAAAALLGRPYSLSGPVVKGEGRGRSLGFPTANVDVPAEKALPAFGVYAVEAAIPGGGWKRGIANFGPRPTFGGEAALEVHLFDFGGDLYGKTLAVSFRAFLRLQKRFASPSELRGQIAADARQARRYFFIERS